MWQVKEFWVVVIDREQPDIPELTEDGIFSMFPILGFKQNTSLPGASSGHRIEHVPFHCPSRTLFVVDHMFAPKFIGSDPALNTAGFKVEDPKLVSDSISKILNIGAKNVLFAHGAYPLYIMHEEDKDRRKQRIKIQVTEQLKRTYRPYTHPKEEIDEAGKCVVS